MLHIPFNRPHVTGAELGYIRQAQDNLCLSGDGPFTKRCQDWIKSRLGVPGAWLTHSGTAALEMAAIVAGIGPGDEVILPSFTFSSTANAFALRGARLVFVDIRPDTFNIDEDKIEAAVTERTKAIVPVHYAGVGCAMGRILELAKARGLIVIEDAAHGVMASVGGKPLGSLGHMAALSFHETKNIVCGEGGALLINDVRFAARAEIVWQKGTDRGRFLRGQVDKYSWVDIGSSFCPSDITAAFLWAQMEQAERITAERLRLWKAYFERLAACEAAGVLRRPLIPSDCAHNAHIFHILLPTPQARDEALAGLNARGIGAIFHYVPLHSSTAGKRLGRATGSMEVTDSVSRRLLRLPLWIGLPAEAIDEGARVLGARVLGAR